MIHCFLDRFLSGSYSYILLASAFVLIIYALLVTATGRRKPAFEKIGTSYDKQGELVWICRSPQQVFTVRAEVMERAQRRRTWSAGMTDDISEHLKTLNGSHKSRR
jgi:hypothetical protein